MPMWPSLACRCLWNLYADTSSHTAPGHQRRLRSVSSVHSEALKASDFALEPRPPTRDRRPREATSIPGDSECRWTYWKRWRSWEPFIAVRILHRNERLKKHDFHTSHTLAPWQHFEALATSLVKGHKDDRVNARASSKRFSSTSANPSNTIPSMSVFGRTSEVCDRASRRPWSLLGIQCLPAKVAVLNWYNHLPGFKHVEIICYVAIPARLRLCTFFLRTGIKSILAICPVSWKIFNQFISVPRIANLHWLTA